ncbi:MAG: hypothetical protein HFI47_08905 [Lachnospiraceae bacterium]|nr:hypothetical protein [Lachnospiraceae bacterium]
MLGAVFGDRRSVDYGAVMNYARITPPAVKENYVDIAGGDSDIDLTEAVGGVAFGDGQIDFKFTLFDRRQAERMKNDLHGRRLRIVLEREPDFYYDGRVKCTKCGQEGTLHGLLMEAKIKPYKREKRATVQVEKASAAWKDVILVNSRMPVMPEITVEGKAVLSYEGGRYAMESGVYRVPELTLYEGRNHLRLQGSGTVKFEYRKGELA